MNEKDEEWLPLDEMILSFSQIQYRRLDADEQLKLTHIQTYNGA